MLIGKQTAAATAVKVFRLGKVPQTAKSEHNQKEGDETQTSHSLCKFAVLSSQVRRPNTSNRSVAKGVISLSQLVFHNRLC